MMTTTLDEKVYSLLDRIDSAASGGELDAQAAEAFDKEKKAIRSELDERKAKAEADYAASTEEDNEALKEAVYRSTDKHTLGKAIENTKVGLHGIYSDIQDDIKAGRGTSITILPAVISNTPAPAGMGAVPRMNVIESPHTIASAFGDADVKRHKWVRPELCVEESKMELFNPSEIGMVDEADAAGNRRQKSYRALRGDLSTILNATGTGAAGAGNIPPGTIYVPTAELPRSFTGPQFDPMLFNVKVTPGDINDMKILQITEEAEATHPAVENKTFALDPAETDPTTNEVVIGAYKTATNMSITIEALMKNYVEGIEQVFGRQGLHRHMRRNNAFATNGTGVNQALGIITAADALTGIPTHPIAHAPLSTWGIDGTDYLAMRGLIKPGLRGTNMSYVFADAVHHRAMVAQYGSNAPGFSALFDTSMADDGRGLLGRIWGGWVVSNEDVSEATNTDNTTVGVYVNGDSWCQRTTGTTISFNYSDKEGLDRVSIYIRTWIDGDFTWPQVAGEFSVARLRT